MWHEARRQERKIRGLMVDYKKRAERRREFYEKIVGFMQIVSLSVMPVCNVKKKHCINKDGSTPFYTSLLYSSLV